MDKTITTPNFADIIATYKADLFAGQKILVSGGSSGIGLAIAKGFAALGGDVTVTGSNPEKIKTEQQRAENGMRFALLDVRDREGVKAFAKQFDVLDVLVNAQGIGRGEAEHEEDVFLDVIEVNLSSMMRLSSTFRPLLGKRGGAIINIASMLSYLMEPEVPAYTASKTGVLGLTRALAHAYGQEGIRVNAIAPGYHKTQMTKIWWSSPVSHDLVVDRTALKRWGSVDDLVGTAIFLASPAAAFITGADLPVDGGYVCGNKMR